MAHPNEKNINDPIDRPQMPAVQKLEYICARAWTTFGCDPRGGGFSFVARPRVIEQALQDLASRDRRLQVPTVIGTIDADVVMFWRDIPFRVRHTVKDDQLWIMKNDQVAPSRLEDRRVAAEIRIHAHKGTIRVVQ